MQWSKYLIYCQLRPTPLRLHASRWLPRTEHEQSADTVDCEWCELHGGDDLHGQRGCTVTVECGEQCVVPAESSVDQVTNTGRYEPCAVRLYTGNHEVSLV